MGPSGTAVRDIQESGLDQHLKSIGDSAPLGNAFFIFLLRQFFMAMPLELSDAGRIDGAHEVSIFLRIIVPLSRSALAVMALFTFMNAWNDYLGPLIYMNVEEKWVLTLVVDRLRSAVDEIGNT